MESQTLDVATGAAQDMRQEAQSRASEVKDQVRSEAHNLYEEAVGQARAETDKVADRAADSIRRMGTQTRALADGRPEEAGPLPDYCRQAAERLEGYADTLQQHGPDGLLRDVRNFARRRPGLFLLGAAAAGFTAGRLIRGAQKAHSQEQQTGPAYPVDQPAPGELPTVTTVETPFSQASVPDTASVGGYAKRGV